VDRPSQEPPEPPESPLSFPVEAPKVAGVEPGAGSPPNGEPLAFPAEGGRPAEIGSTADPLAFPAQATAPPTGDPLAFPVEPTPLSAGSPPPAAAQPTGDRAGGALANPLDFPPPQAPPRSAEPSKTPDSRGGICGLPFPVAQLPGTVPAPPPAAPTAPTPPAQPIPATEAPAGTPRLLRFLPPALTAAAALMATGGLFLPLFRLQQHVSVRQRYFDAQLTVTETAWGSRIEIPGQEATDQASSPVGIPVVLAVLLLAVAAVLFWQAVSGMSTVPAED